MKISRVLDPTETFFRSVDIGRDLDSKDFLGSLIVHESLREHVTRMTTSITTDPRARAWRLTGDYGSGKSTVALLLLHLLAGRPLPRRLQRLKLRGSNSARYLPVPVVGTRGSLAGAISDAVERQISAVLGRRKPPAFLKTAKSIVKAALRAKPPGDMDRRVLEFLTAAREYVASNLGFDGLVLVVDELGKFLEHAARSDASSDPYLLQQLAESTVTDPPMAIVVVAHQAFGEYAKGSEAERVEWEKIAGRFHEVVLQPSLAEVVALLGAALRVKAPRVTPVVKKLGRKHFSRLAENHWFPGADDAALSKAAVQIYPIDLSALPLMGQFFRRFGQNERSLFGFLASEEPLGLRAFAEREALGSLFRVHDFYDYVRASFGAALLARNQSRWHEIETVVERAAGGDELEQAVLKTIGVMNLLEAQGFVATVDSVTLALKGEARPQAVSAALGRLREHAVVYDRGPRRGYALWPHSSVDLRAKFEAMEEKTPRDGHVSRRLAARLSARPIVARRHYIGTGNLRYFNVLYVPFSELESGRKRNGVPGDSAAVGELAIVLTDNASERRRAHRWLAERRGLDGGLYALPRPVDDLLDDVVELEVWDRLLETDRELRSDEVAAREARRSSEAASQRLGRLVAHRLGPTEFNRSSGIVWMRGGKPLDGISDARTLVSELSRICDDLFPDAPQIHNELLNRAELSSAAAAARMRLIERIMDSSDIDCLGFEQEGKRPPEMSMYLSVLAATGLHRTRKTDDGTFGVLRLPKGKEDRCNVLPALKYLKARLRSAGGRRVSVADLQTALAARPYGVHAGLFLVLLAVFVRLNRRDLALYEEGTFVPDVGGDEFARMVKRPERFELQLVEVKGLRSDVFDRILALLVPEAESDDERRLLDVVRPLLKFYSRLPRYSRRSMSVSPVAAAVRDVLASAREPASLLFEDLPRACGVDPITPRKTRATLAVLEEYVGRLRDALRELGRTYASLLERVDSAVGEALGAGKSWSRNEVATLAARLGGRLREPRLRGFARLLADSNLDGDDWTEAMGSFVLGEPPAHWTDATAARFPTEVHGLVASFNHALSLAEVAVWGDPDDDRYSVKVSLTHPDGHGHERVVLVDPADSARAVELAAKIDRVLARERGVVGLAAVSQALWSLLAATSSHEAAE